MLERVAPAARGQREFSSRDLGVAPMSGVWRRLVAAVAVCGCLLAPNREARAG